MRLLERLRRHREITRLRAEVRRTPAPAAFGALAERLLAHGRLDEALAAAEEGLRLFPDADRLAHVRSFVKRKTLAGSIRRLRGELGRRPSPVAYVHLAEIYRELGSEDEALETATQCAERFPLNEAPYLIEGEIRLERFLRDRIAKDGELAEAALRRATRINAHSIKGALLLAELYHLVGAVGACREQLGVVLAANPAAPGVQEFLDGLDAAGGDAPEPDFYDLVRAVESEGEFARDPAAFPAAIGAGPRRPARRRVDVDGVADAVVRLGIEDGMRNSVVLDADGVVIAQQGTPLGLAPDAFAELVRRLRAIADDASRRMDTGALVRAEIDGPSGSVTVMRLRSLTVGALYSEPLRADRVWEMLQDCSAPHVTPVREEAPHA